MLTSLRRARKPMNSFVSTNTLQKCISVGSIARLLLLVFTLLLLLQFIILHDFTLEPKHSIIQFPYDGPRSFFVSNCRNESMSAVPNPICTKEFERVTSDLPDIRVPGLTMDDFERSIAHVGNRFRLAQFAHRLVQSSFASLIRSNHTKEIGTPVSVVVCGGSISLGHGVTPFTARYSDQLEVWLNAAFPVSSSLKHQVFNRGAHGADMCAMAKRINFLGLPVAPDLIILEFAVNDYQGQDHKVHIDHKTDVFFEGFQSLAVCAETVVYKLLTDYPNAAILFLEFQTAILNRKTAQLLHLGVAQHYQIPVLSYADVLWPDFYRLIDTLKPYDYSLPAASSLQDQIHAEFAYPHGCAPCQAEHIIESFRDKGCKSICVFLERSGLFPLGKSQKCDTGMTPCFVPFLAHDAVHPSAVGHRIARDLVANLIGRVAFDTCNGRTFPPYHLPTHGGWLVAASTVDHEYGAELMARSNFVLVQDTMEIFAKQNPLVSTEHTPGFELKADSMARKGWIATNPAGKESVSFSVDLPVGKCYAMFLSVLKSYETVGTFTVTVEDRVLKTKTSIGPIDCLWKPRISIPADVQITADDPTECTGKCKITILTHAEIPGRRGNLIKIMSLAVRECLPQSSAVRKVA